MPYLNVKERVLEAKVVYYGAGLSGKTTNLEQIKAGATNDGRVGEMMSLNTDGDRTLFFDYLPFELGKLNGLDVKVQLYTVPGQTKYAETRRRVLAGADGVVLVLDSQAGALDRNKQTVNDLYEHMRANNLDPAGTPILVQLNKRDLPTAMDADALRRECGVAALPYTEAVACDGKGVFETLRVACKMVLESIKGSARDGQTGKVAAGQGSGLDGQKMHDELRRHVGPDGLPLPAAAQPASPPAGPPAMPAAAGPSPAEPSPAASTSMGYAAPAPSAGAGGNAPASAPMAAAPAARPMAPPAGMASAGMGAAPQAAPAGMGLAAVAPAAAPAPSAPRPQGNGHPGPNGAVNGGGPGAPAAAAPPPAASGIEAVFRSLRDEIAKMNAKSDAIAAAAAAQPAASGDGGGFSPAQVNEIIQAQRELGRRLDTLERNVGGYLDRSMQRLEQQLQAAATAAGQSAGGGSGAGLEAAKQIATKLAGATDALAGKVDGLGQHVSTLQGDLGAVRQRGDSLAKGLAEVGRVLAQMSETVTQLEAKAGTRGGSGAGGEAPDLAPLERRISDLAMGLEGRLAALDEKAVTAKEVDSLVTSVSSMVIGELRAQDESFREMLKREREAAAERAAGTAPDAAALDEMAAKVAGLEAKLDTLSTKLDAVSGRTVDQLGELLDGVKAELSDVLDRFGQEQRENFAKLETALTSKLDATHDRVSQVDERLERHAGGVDARFDELADQGRSHAQAVETWFGQVLQAVNETVDELRRGKGKWWKNT